MYADPGSFSPSSARREHIDGSAIGHQIPQRSGRAVAEQGAFPVRKNGGKKAAELFRTLDQAIGAGMKAM